MEQPDLPALLDHTHDIFLVLTAGGEITYANAAAERILGYDSEQLVGQDAFVFVHPDDREQTRGTFDRLVASEGAVGEVEHRTLAADGSWVWLQSRMEGTADPEIDGYVVSSRDVTEQKRAEAAHDETRLRLEELATNTDDVLWMFTADWEELLFVNEAFEALWGMSTETVREEPRRFLEGIHPDDRDRVEAAMAQLTAGEQVDLEYRVNPDRDYRRWVWVQGVPIEEDGEVVRVVGFARDVTDRRRRERQLLVMDRLLRHNLNNDMNVVLGYADLAREAGCEAVAEHLDVVVRAGEQLLTTAAKERDIVDVLVRPPDEGAVEVASMVDEAVAACRDRYPDARFVVSMPDGLEASVAPPVRLALDELLENAVEHATTDAPVVELVVERGDAGVEIAVLDDCPPVPENEYRPLFETEVSDRYHGTGLGLTLACWVVDFVDGDIAFERRETGGNRIVLSLPVEE